MQQTERNILPRLVVRYQPQRQWDMGRFRKRWKDEDLLDLYKNWPVDINADCIYDNDGDHNSKSRNVGRYPVLQLFIPVLNCKIIDSRNHILKRFIQRHILLAYLYLVRKRLAFCVLCVYLCVSRFRSLSASIR